MTEALLAPEKTEIHHARIFFPIDDGRRAVQRIDINEDSDRGFVPHVKTKSRADGSVTYLACVTNESGKVIDTKVEADETGLAAAESAFARARELAKLAASAAPQSSSSSMRP